LVWRITIGTFTMPNKFRVTARGLKVPRVCILQALRWILILSVVLLNCGDIESNPELGPGTGRGNKTMGQRDSERINNGRHSSTRFRQSTLS